MFWSDATHQTISSAQLNGTGPRVLVHSGIDVPGELIDNLLYCSLLSIVTNSQLVNSQAIHSHDYDSFVSKEFILFYSATSPHMSGSEKLIFHGSTVNVVT